MNLLFDAWIPTKCGHSSLEDVLSNLSGHELALPRDDMEMAALQLAIALTQAVLSPADDEELRDRAEVALSVEAYRAAATYWRDAFRLDHPVQPFMQSRGVKAVEPTPIQKLFVGLPEGNNHAFFNEAGEITRACPSCTVIALFNQAMNCPSFGGGFKGSLRGGAPVTTLAMGRDLRETIWLNVLTRERIAQHYPNTRAQNDFTWCSPIVANARMAAHELGFLRGLFWQPTRLELVGVAGPGVCQACDQASEYHYTGFAKEKFNYTLEGLWLHPWSPRLWDVKKGGEQERERYLGFTTEAPAWAQLSHYLFRSQSLRQGSEPALVLSQFREVFLGRIPYLAVAGYRNNQAALLERRHELYPLPRDWSVTRGVVEPAIVFALQIRAELRNKLFGFGKQAGVGKLQDAGERAYFAVTEPKVHTLLRELAFRDGKVALDQFRAEAKAQARDLFESLTEPYRHNPKGMRSYAYFRAELAKALHQLA